MNRFSSSLSGLAAAAWLAAPLAALAADPDPSNLEPVFNGKDLAGWKVPDDNRWWSVKDGILEVRSGPQRKGSTLWTTEEFTDFVMELEFRFGEGTVDSGVFVRTDREQIQIGISGSLKRDMTASPYIAGKGYPVEAEGVAELLKADDWNRMRIEARGKKYTVWLNGEKVMTYESESAIEKGPVGLQLHGDRDMAIDFRNIRMAAL